jgi:serine/threonine-protein kinase
MTPAADRSTPRLLLLGGIDLRGLPAKTAHPLMAQPKTVAFLAFLALSPDRRFQRRDRLCGLLWPELDQAHARTALRKTVHAVRAVLGAEAVVGRGDEELAIPAEALRCDAEEFAAAADAGRIAPAIEMYRGELMPGFHISECNDFDYWLTEERAALRDRMAAAAWALACSLENEERHTDAGAWARKAVHYTGTDERVLRRAVQMLVRIGDRAGALRLYSDFVKRVRETLDVEPSAETVALIESLRRG